MRRYKVYVEDDRSPDPTVVLVECIDDARAQEIAMHLLAETPHHRAVELTREDRRIFQSIAAPRPPPALDLTGLSRLA